ncbi:hypothetical protein [Shinella sp.]|uniref:hypothetical protein n=1 Tax=Shinella sp. TaxID=1870904 RepID=UPI00258C66F5|nr:hypothetical protein [Shinella sp.]MCW5712790.1 hypothetical protein [Shinella sp.]
MEKSKGDIVEAGGLYSQRHIPEKIALALRRWDKQSAVLQYSYMGLVLAGAISSFMVPVVVGVVDEMFIRILSSISGFSITIISAFGLKEKSNEMRAAYAKLRARLMKYEHHTDYTVADLVNDFSSISDGLSEIKGDGLKADPRKALE